MKKLTKEEFREMALRDISKKKEKENNEYLGYLTELRSKVKKAKKIRKIICKTERGENDGKGNSLL